MKLDFPSSHRKWARFGPGPEARTLLRWCPAPWQRPMKGCASSLRFINACMEAYAKVLGDESDQIVKDPVSFLEGHQVAGEQKEILRSMYEAPHGWFLLGNPIGPRPGRFRVFGFVEGAWRHHHRPWREQTCSRGLPVRTGWPSSSGFHAVDSFSPQW